MITFSGLDGSGKSSVIAWLRAVLEARGQAVTVLHMNDDVGVYALVRGARDRVKRWLRRPVSGPVPPGVPDQRAVRRAGPPAGRSRIRDLIGQLRYTLIWNKPVRRGLYLVDLLLFQAQRLWVERLRGHLLIMDRYFYDTLVDLSDGDRAGWTRWLHRLTPTPALPVLLDVTPEDSFARKGEYSIAYLRRRWTAYHDVFSRIDSAVIILNQDLETTQALLRRWVEARVPSVSAWGSAPATPPPPPPQAEGRGVSRAGSSRAMPGQ